jgi:hypothetical protein
LVQVNGLTIAADTVAAARKILLIFFQFRAIFMERRAKSPPPVTP